VSRPALKHARRSAAVALSISPSVTADQHPIALDEREIGGSHRCGTAKHLAHTTAGFFASNLASTALDAA
jgi:hypothetical protein